MTNGFGFTLLNVIKINDDNCKSVSHTKTPHKNGREHDGIHTRRNDCGEGRFYGCHFNINGVGHVNGGIPKASIYN